MNDFVKFREIEQLKELLNVYLEEHRRLSSEIEKQLEMSSNTFSYSITGMAIILAATPFIIQYQANIIFAIASFIFYGLALTQIRYAKTIIGIHNYIKDILAPNVRVVLHDLAPHTSKSFQDVLQWENKSTELVYFSHIWELPIEAARYFIPVIAGIVSWIAFTQTLPKLPSVLNVAINAFNVFSILYISAIMLSLKKKVIPEKGQA